MELDVEQILAIMIKKETSYEMSKLWRKGCRKENRNSKKM